MTGITETMFVAPEMAPVFSDRALVQRMLDFEAALARAEAGAGIIPQTAAEAIASKCRVDLVDLAELSRDTASAGTPVIPLVRMLTDRVKGEARKFVHWSATSQDVVDTAMMLQMRDGLDLIIHRLLDIAAVCASLANRYRHTPMAGRTLLQHAVPITFGLKAARWLALATRLIERLRSVRERALVVQFGGAAGTLAPLGNEGVRVIELLARELGLAAPDLPWHTERDRIGEIAATLGIVATGMAKVATDLVLLAQTEVGEVSTTGAAEGRSSTMPQKRNPVEATAALACAHLATGLVMTLLAAGVQEHERGVGGWQAEWEATPELFQRTSGAVHWVHRAVQGLQVDTDRMHANLALTHGLIMAEALTMALAPHVGREAAYRIVSRVSDRAMQTGVGLREAAPSDAQISTVLSPEQLERAFDVSGYLGSTDAFIERALERFRRL